MRTTFLCLLFLIGSTSVATAGICDLCHNMHGPDVGGVHAAGVGACNHCHTMHNSQDGALVDSDSPSGNPFLLIDSTPSDVCLSCHADWISETFGNDPLNPPTEVGAGNFVFLLEDNLNDGFEGASNPIAGDAAGHSINAPSFAVGADGTLLTSPGGMFPSDQLGCTSCHDPHGNGNYRMLYSQGNLVQGFYTFANAAPDADGLSIYHGRERNTKHSAYRSGVSEWCANCHGDFHESNGSLTHPSGSNLGNEISTAYGNYNGTADPTGGSVSSAYLAAVPFEDPSMGITSTNGPAAASGVMCLTCHRAHASSSPDAGRWDFNVTFLHEDGAESGSYPIPDPYANLGQRSLCNKCHVKDISDALP